VTKESVGKSVNICRCEWCVCQVDQPGEDKSAWPLRGLVWEPMGLEHHWWGLELAEHQELVSVAEPSCPCLTQGSCGSGALEGKPSGGAGRQSLGPCRVF
jgi:hypothetical protein